FGAIVFNTLNHSSLCFCGIKNKITQKSLKNQNSLIFRTTLKHFFGIYPSSTGLNPDFFCIIWRPEKRAGN
ncbi:MAG: hypothetical protein IJT13_05200, partial [Bacteroidaceae bacterium]|nr:hypothetical protein [Bacteroidaceae bacterium]